MSEKSTFGKFIKSEYERNEVPFNELLWNQLDTQLTPYRQAEEKRKRRVIAWWSGAALLVLGGSYFLLNKNNNTNQTSSQSTTSSTLTKDKTNTTSNNNTADISSEERKQKVTPGQVSSNENSFEQKNNNTSKSSSFGSTAGKPELNNTERYVNKEVDSKTNGKTAKRNTKPNRNSKPVQESSTVENEYSNNVEKENSSTITEITKTEESTVAEVKKPEENKAKDNKIIADVAIITEAKKEVKGKLLPIEIYATGGLNMASPFDKSGYYAGVQIVKPIDDKRIFAGIKLSNNNLHHQFVATKNSSATPNTTDAVINKMTVLQIPFGYQFTLSKPKNSKPLQLNVGFEPSFITGLQTVFYDDNGIPGGPRTPVVNSPLLRNAINKFNVSFIAGFQKQITNKIGLNVSGGYNLIDLTDKQYYNRTSTNNNLKYLQLGLMFRLK